MVATSTVSNEADIFNKETLLDVYRKMLLIRRFEERMAQLYQQGKIGGFCHLYIGQEAVAVAAEYAITKDDYMITSYRDHGHALVRGSDPMACAAELVGRETGLVRGKGGSMHFFDVENGFYGGHGIVGGQIPIGTGMAFASHYRKDNRVTLCFFGEAAMNQGTFHESLNMASLWDLPIIYICENNRYGMGTAVERASAVTELSKRTADAYSVEGHAVDGMDFFATYACFKKAVDKARQDSRPTFIDAETYRFRGHSMSDPVHSHYRTKEEVEEMRKRDPITVVVKYLDEHGMANQAELEEIDKEIKNTVGDAVKRAIESPEPRLETLYEDVLVEG
ncbi:MAG: pyruvate dehydrogenase (acetyl-transferring) E1 component subunit alpha [bacterium]|jgi:pyruvate dehydrogenase E1 component alpha subunit|nr:pyruvate dehydrogenase (acetyl-transferring) E1 component subunit alpha [bacterium]